MVSKVFPLAMDRVKTSALSGAETQEQVRLTFPSLEAAQTYAMREGIDAHVIPASQPKLKLQSYADNFR